MRDIENDGSLRRQFPDTGEETIRFPDREHRRRFVENEDARPFDQGLGDLDDLLQRHGKVGDARADVDLGKSKIPQDRRCSILGGAPVDAPSRPGGRHTPEHDVLGDGDVRQQAEFLIDGADAKTDRVARVGE